MVPGTEKPTDEDAAPNASTEGVKPEAEDASPKQAMELPDEVQIKLRKLAKLEGKYQGNMN